MRDHEHDRAEPERHAEDAAAKAQGRLMAGLPSRAERHEEAGEDAGPDAVPVHQDEGHVAGHDREGHLDREAFMVRIGTGIGAQQRFGPFCRGALQSACRITRGKCGLDHAHGLIDSLQQRRTGVVSRRDCRRRFLHTTRLWRRCAALVAGPLRCGLAGFANRPQQRITGFAAQLRPDAQQGDEQIDPVE
jgi:hypothetical protein